MFNLDWEKMFKRYVWDDTRTPYLVRAERLTREQARYELYTYTVLLGVGAAVFGIAALSPDMPHGATPVVSLACWGVVAAAIWFGMTKNHVAAALCAATPVGVLLYFFVYGFLPKLGAYEKAVVIAIVVLWLRYSWRIVQIAKHYPVLRETQPPGEGL
jgi:hypothetical protein